MLQTIVERSGERQSALDSFTSSNGYQYAAAMISSLFSDGKFMN